MDTLIEPPMEGAAPAAVAHPEKETSASRIDLVKQLSNTVKDAKTFWKSVFDRIDEDIRFAAGDQWKDAEDKMGDKYQANFVQRELNQQVSSLYARNPTVKASRKKRMEYTVWDGSNEQLEAAKAAIAESATTNLPPPPEAMAVLADHENGRKNKAMLDRLAQTLELAATYQIEEQKPSFESQCKDLILREKTCGVAFVGVKYQRTSETTPGGASNNVTMFDKIRRIAALANQLEENPGHGEDSAAMETVRLMIQSLTAAAQSGQDRVITEGIVFDFKPVTNVIVDPHCRSFVEFVGANWVAEEMLLTPDQILAQWQLDVTKTAGVIRYQDGRPVNAPPAMKTNAGGDIDASNRPGGWKDNDKACVWIIHHKGDQMCYAILDGYNDFLEEPEAPWPPVAGFWHIAALKLNRTEVDCNRPEVGVTIYGQSACRLLRPMQEEFNRSQEALREHRQANRPGYLCGKDTFDSEDRKRLANRAPHDVIALNNVPPGGDVSKVLAAIPTIAIDGALYETGNVMQHALLVTGSQQANLGQQMAGEKATGQAIAEQSRIQAVGSEVDSLDKFLTTVVRIAGEMILQEMTIETLRSTVGPGAMDFGSEMARKEILNHLFLEIEAGSSGRPNRALELDNLQKMLPQLIELAGARGLPLDPLVKYAAQVMDFKFDIEEWLASAAPMPAMPGAMMPAPQAGSVPPPAPPAPTAPAGMPASIPAAVQRMNPVKMP